MRERSPVLPLRPLQLKGPGGSATRRKLPVHSTLNPDHASREQVRNPASVAPPSNCAGHHGGISVLNRICDQPGCSQCSTSDRQLTKRCALAKEFNSGDGRAVRSSSDHTANCACVRPTTTPGPMSAADQLSSRDPESRGSASEGIAAQRLDHYPIVTALRVSPARPNSVAVCN